MLLALQPVAVVSLLLVGNAALPVVSLALLNVGLLRRDERAAACHAVRGVQRRPLFRRDDRHCSGTPALGPRALEHDAIAAIGVIGLELDASAGIRLHVVDDWQGSDRLAAPPASHGFHRDWAGRAGAG